MNQIIPLKSWLKSFCSYFRKKIEQIDSTEKKWLLDYLDITLRCQFLVFLLRKDNVELQIFLCIKDSNLPDLDIKIFGPYDIIVINERKDIFHIEELDLFLKNLNHIKFSKGFKNRIENEIIHSINTIDYEIEYTKINEIIRNKKGQQAYLWIINGKIQNLNIDDLFINLHDDIILLYKYNSQEIEHYAGYILPPVWIGNIPILEFNDKLKGKGRIKSHIMKYEFEYKKTKITIESDGFIVISEKKKRKALKFINEILGYLLLEDFNMKKMNNNELIHSIENKDENKLNHVYSLTGLELLGDRFDYYNADFFNYRIIITEENFSNYLKSAESLTKNEKASQILLILLEANTNLNDNQYAQSFILSWTLVEQYINNVWNNFIYKFEFTGKRNKKLIKDIRYLTIDHKLEILNISRKLDDNMYNQIMRLKKLRNKLIHELKSIKRIEAKQCFIFSRDLVMKYINN